METDLSLTACTLLSTEIKDVWMPQMCLGVISAKGTCEQLKPLLPDRGREILRVYVHLIYHLLNKE